MSQVIRILIVDDSAFVRKVVREMLSRSPGVEVVGTARDGVEALEMVASLQPDVVTCDLMMPRLDGVEFVREQMARRPLPILILTASPEDGEQAIIALNAGAVELVQKPTALATDELLQIREQLLAKVMAAARAPVRKPEPERIYRPTTLVTATASCVDLVVLGISTGGPQALRQMLPQFPADFPVPILIVLHMPIGYTALFAEKLNEVSPLVVAEASDGQLVQPGVALLAPAGRHLTVIRNRAGAIETRLSLHPLDRNHRPSADVLFRSAAEICGGRVLGVIMTGMGEDGKQGAGWVKAQGGTILTEAEESCIIYGMPRSVVEAGLSDRVVHLRDMPRAIIESL